MLFNSEIWVAKFHFGLMLMLKEKIKKYLTKAMLTFVVYAVLYHIRQQYQAGMLDLLQLSQQPLPLKSH